MDKYYVEVIERLQRIIFNQVNEIEELKKEKSSMDVRRILAVKRL